MGDSKRSSCVNYFKCCKSKQFIHFVCVKCCSIFHKSCLPRFRSQIKFLNGNKIICCTSETDKTSDEDISNLEKSISDLMEDSIVKDKYIDKLKHEKDIFMQEVLKTEEDMAEIICKQEKLISELNEQIKNLQKKIELKTMVEETKSVKTVSTQTSNFKLNKSISTQTEQIDNPRQHVGTQTILKVNSTGAQLEERPNNKNIHITSNIVIGGQKEILTKVQSNKPKKRLLSLCDGINNKIIRQTISTF